MNFKRSIQLARIEVAAWFFQLALWLLPVPPDRQIHIEVQFHEKPEHV